MKWILDFVRFRSVASRILVPTLLALIGGTVATLAYLGSATMDNTIESATANASRTIGQFRMLRGYYARSVVGPVKRHSDLRVHYDHSADDTIPLPATMIHDMSELLGEDENGAHLSLYSSFPFPNRANRRLDQFARDALAAIERNPDEAFVRTEMVEGQRVVRVAQADRLVAESCVSCHNAHPDTPRSDWRLGDVRGVLEVTIPIEQDLARSDAMMGRVRWIAVGIYGALGLLLLLLLFALSRRISVVKAASEAASRGDLSFDIEDRGSRDEVGAVTTSFRVMVESLRTLVARIQSLSGDVTSSSRQIASGLSELSIMTENGAAAVHETSAATEEMTATVEQNADNASRTHALTEEAAKKAGQGEATVGQAVESMRKLAESSAQVSEIVGLVDEIAFQTNMLALNAAVEAARAGEHGRGFAVVATEVRRLSRRTAVAAEEIQTLVKASTEQTKIAQALVVESGEVFGEITEAVKVVAHNASEIAAASREQSTGIEEVNKAVVAMDQLVESSTRMIGEASRLATELTREADELGGVVAEFHLGGGPGDEPPQERSSKQSIQPVAFRKGLSTAPAPKVGGSRVGDLFESLRPGPGSSPPPADAGAK